MSTESAQSRSLSAAMSRAGFCSANARMQSGLALAMEDLLKLLMGSCYVFGSFADGWGSNLSRIDGSVASDSDIDLTYIFTDAEQPIHIHQQGRSVEGTGSSQNPTCCAAVCDPTNIQLADYEDGHVTAVVDFKSPNIPVKQSIQMPAIDLIMAHLCCAYPRIELLQPGYSSCMPQSIMQLLREEVLGDSPRCHAVAATPPGLPAGSRLRVSTTLLERAVMHNLSTVQGQLFILLKFLIKRVISLKVKGIKTYMAKNLLFYMLDETPAEQWRPENLLELLHQSLQILVAMIKSSESENTCMRHFFLRDANVYFKQDHHPKQRISEVVTETMDNLHNFLATFESSLPTFQVNVILFPFLSAFLLAIELLVSTDYNYTNFVPANEQVNRILYELKNETLTGFESERLQQLLLEVDRDVPDAAPAAKATLRASVLFRMGRLSNPERFDQTDCSLGFIRCPPDPDAQLTVAEAKSAALDKLQQMHCLGGLTVSSDNTIAACPMLTTELSPLFEIFRQAFLGRKVYKQQLMLASLSSSIYSKLLMSSAFAYDSRYTILFDVICNIEKILRTSVGGGTGDRGPSQQNIEMDGDTELDPKLNEESTD